MSPGSAAEAAPDGEAEGEALKAVAAVAEARLAALPAAASLEDGTEVGDMLGAFASEKRRVLQACVEALTAQAANPKAREAVGTQGGEAPKLPELPGLPELPKLPDLPFKLPF